MAQPTRSDDQVVRRRLSHNNLRRKKWRRRQPRAERKRPRRSGSFSALNLRGARRAPHFFIPGFLLYPASCCSPDAPSRARVSPRSEVATTPGRRARRQSALAAGRPRNPPVKGGILKWRRRRRAERRRRRRRGKFAAWREWGRIRVPFFVYRYRRVVPSQICTRRITSPG